MSIKIGWRASNVHIYIREEEMTTNCEKWLWFADLNIGGNCVIPTNYVKETLEKSFMLGSS